MFAAIGAILSIAGTALATIALLLLRGELCPVCGTAGSMALVSDLVTEIPGCCPTLSRSRRCAKCGATVVEREATKQRSRRPRLPALVNHVAR